MAPCDGRVVREPPGRVRRGALPWPRRSPSPALADGAVPMSPSASSTNSPASIHGRAGGLRRRPPRRSGALAARRPRPARPRPARARACRRRPPSLPSLAPCASVADRLRRRELGMDPEIPFNAVRIRLALIQDAALEAHECGSEEVLLARRGRQLRPPRSCAPSRACTPRPSVRRWPLRGLRTVRAGGRRRDRTCRARAGQP